MARYICVCMYLCIYVCMYDNSLFLYIRGVFFRSVLFCSVKIYMYIHTNIQTVRIMNLATPFSLSCSLLPVCSASLTYE